MPKNISVTFLGTSSGGGPIPSRVCSSLAINIDGELWLTDCAEATQIQLSKAGLRCSRVTKIFITHLHVDHCLGIVPLLCSILYSFSVGAGQRHVDIFGPPGLRLLIRTTLKITGATLSGSYAVHELVTPSTQPSCSTERNELLSIETAGRDILCDETGRWRAIERASNGIVIDAGPLIHRVPCIGYVFVEPARAAPFTKDDHFDLLDTNHQALLSLGHKNPRALLGKLSSERQPIELPDGSVLSPPPLSIVGRKLVILGDTCDSSGMIGLAENASLLVHEATNAYIVSGTPPESMTPLEKTAVREKAISRGHSTADMAGAFAQLIGARRLFLNHFSTKYPDPGPVPAESEPTFGKLITSHHAKAKVIQAIEDQASEAWGAGQRAVAATDCLTVEIRTHEIESTIV